MKSLRPLLVAILLALLTISSFAGLARNGFTRFDDPDYLTDNRRVMEGLTSAGVVWAFSTTSVGNWHPLTWLSHNQGVVMFGMRPGAHHLVSLAFHTANALLLFLLLRALTGAFWRSALVAALFAVHPLHVESVAWASERKDVLATLLTLLAALTWLRAVRRHGPWCGLPATLLFAGALMAKPMPVTLPFLLLLLDWWPLGRWSPATSAGGGVLARLRRSVPPLNLWIEKAPLFALAALSSALTIAVQGIATASPTVLPFAIRVAHALAAYSAYLAKTVWPFGLTLYYTHTGSYPPRGEFLGAILVLAGITALALRSRPRSPHLAVGWAWFLGSLVPAIGLVQVGSQGMADRYTYLPLVGLFIMVAWTAGAFASGRPSRVVATAGAALLLTAGLALRSADQVALWKDDESLFGHALAVDPNNWMAHDSLGSASAARGDTQGAIAHFREALLFDPFNAYALGHLGRVLVEAGRPQEGLENLRKAVDLEPAIAANQHGLGVALAASGQTEAALAHFREAARLAPDEPGARYSLGLALAERGDLEGAVDNLREAVRLNPAGADGHNNLGLALASQGKFEEAAEHYRRAIAVDPGHALAHNNLGIAYAVRERYREAGEEFRKALEARPDLAEARKNLERLAGRGPLGGR